MQTGEGRLNSHQRDTLAAVFRHPLSHNLEWHDMLSFLEALGQVQETHKGHLVVSIGGETETFEPRGGHKDIGADDLSTAAESPEAGGVQPRGRRRLGRRPLARDVTEDLVLAADIGGTHMRAALVDGAGAVVHRRSAPTPTWSEAPPP